MRVARKTKRQQRAREQLLDAARIVLARDGLDRLTVAEVAKQADVSKPAVYYYFDDKEALVRELIVDGIERQVAALCAAAEAAPTGLDALRAVARGLVAHYADRSAEFRLHYLWSQVAGYNAPDMVARLEPRMNRLFELVEAKLIDERARKRLRHGVHPRRLAVSSWLVGYGMVSFVSLFEATGSSSKHDFSDLLEETLSAFLRGVSLGKTRPATYLAQRKPMLR